MYGGQDRVSGAAEIEQKVISYIGKYVGSEELFEKCHSLLEKYPSMASIWNIANFAFLDDVKSMEEMGKANEEVILNGIDAVKGNSVILTYSRSSTVSKILQGCRDNDIRVICSESRPKYEGRKLAKELTSKGIDVVFTTDAALGFMVDEADMILIGADAILEDRIVNKAGTAPLLTYANEEGKEVYVAASPYKAFPFVFVKEECRKEVWKDSPERVEIKNFYFDVADIRHVNYFITEKGISKSAPEFTGKLADEILEIKNMLKSKYRMVK